MPESIHICDDAVARLADHRQQKSPPTPSDLLAEIARLIERCLEIKEELNYRHADINLIDHDMARISGRMVRIGQAHCALGKDPTSDAQAMSQVEEARAKLRVAFEEMMPGTPGRDEDYFHSRGAEKKEGDEKTKGDGDGEQTDHVYDAPANQIPSVPLCRPATNMNLDGAPDLACVPLRRPTERFTPADLAGVYASLRDRAVALIGAIVDADARPLDVHERHRGPAADLVVVIYKTRDRYELLINDARDHGEVAGKRAAAACAELERETAEIARLVLDAMADLKRKAEDDITGGGESGDAGVGAGVEGGSPSLPGYQTESAAGEMMMSGALPAPGEGEVEGCRCGGACGGQDGSGSGSFCVGPCDGCCSVQK